MNKYNLQANVEPDSRQESTRQSKILNDFLKSNLKNQMHVESTVASDERRLKEAYDKHVDIYEEPERRETGNSSSR
jgi:hypothetical protein